MTQPISDTPVIRVVLVDDHSVMRLGLRTLLSAAPDITVVGEGATGDEAIALAEALDPDVIIMDLSMNSADGTDGTLATQKLVQKGSRARVLVLTMHDEEDYLIPLLDAGASGYVVKSAASTELLEAIRTVAGGRTFVRPEAAPILAGGWARRAMRDAVQAKYDILSDREREVFLLIAQGYSTSQIGERLFISGKTADTYRRRINDKLGFSERTEYVKLALALGLLVAGTDTSGDT
jgi:two-component system, NarL family, response regulator NreC